METLPGELTLRGPKSIIPEDDLTGQVRTVDSQAGQEGSSTEEQGRPLPGKEDRGRQAVTTGVPGGNQTDTMTSVRRGF